MNEQRWECFIEVERERAGGVRHYMGFWLVDAALIVGNMEAGMPLASLPLWGGRGSGGLDR